jgi:hypothetical protein
MTLILTHLSRFGIIHASDSNLTSGQDSAAGQGQKTFPVTYLNAGLTVAGAYSVGGRPMNAWIKDFIYTQSASGASSLAAFADALKARLESEMLPDEKKAGSMVHIAGYVEKSGWDHPEFYYVRNCHGIDPATGEYLDIRDQFLASEDFWTRDCPKSNLMAAFQSGGYQIYINGFASGRIGYVALQKHMNDFFSAVWAQPKWKFRQPGCLAEAVLFVKLYMSIIATLFRVSDYAAPFIGGDTQIHEIPQPPKTVTTC